MQITKSLWVLLAAALASPLCFSQNQLNLGQLPPGALVLNLSATEQQQVQQDTLNVSLEFAAQGKDKSALQDQVNKAIQQALGYLRALNNSAIHYQTNNYQVYVINNDGSVFNDSTAIWRAQQGLQLDSTDSERLLEVIGALQQQGLSVSNLYYSLSRSKYEAVASELSGKVLVTLQQRADATAKVLKKSKAELIEVSLDGNSNIVAAPYARGYELAMSSADKATPPSADPGETEVSVSVAARAILSP
jgi:uncharacterized protein